MLPVDVADLLIEKQSDYENVSDMCVHFDGSEVEEDDEVDNIIDVLFDEDDDLWRLTCSVVLIGISLQSIRDIVKVEIELNMKSICWMTLKCTSVYLQFSVTEWGLYAWEECIYMG